MTNMLRFDGKFVIWTRDGGKGLPYKVPSGIYNGSSGRVGNVTKDGKTSAFDFRRPEYQCYQELGPVPEGKYRLRVFMAGTAKFANSPGEGGCYIWPNSEQTGGVQSVLRGDDIPADRRAICEEPLSYWGWHRIRFDPVGPTKDACKGKLRAIDVGENIQGHLVQGARSGFNFHDSEKGQSEGCIEIDKDFFLDLEIYVKAMRITKNNPSIFLLDVKYTGNSTAGNTARRSFNYK
jgi:hypothetical protein